MEFHCTICKGQVSKKQWRQHRTCQNISTCNDFQCDYLAAMGKRDAPVAKPVYLVAMDGSDVVNRVQKTNGSTSDRPET